MSAEQQQAQDDGPYVYLDPFLIRRRQVNLGLSQTQLVNAMCVATNTAKAAFRGKAIYPQTALRLAKQLKCEVTDLLAPRDPAYVAPASVHGPMAGALEWETQECLESGRVASNGLLSFACQMKHRFIPSRQGRGKFYYFALMSPKVRSDMQEKLNRHAEASARVRMHPNVSHNLASTPAAGDAGWWVIDDWVGASTLADRLESGAWPSSEQPRLLLDVATGLQALHKAGVVFRELAPARVLISDNDGRAVLTDFELAKLLDGSPSVSSEWPDDPFRAPEVDGGSATVQADLYSFGKVAVAAAAGQPVDDADVPDIFNKAGMPKQLSKLLIACLEPVPLKRPAELAPLVKELTAWQKKVSR
jgi:serine/threonine protein kinase